MYDMLLKEAFYITDAPRLELGRSGMKLLDHRRSVPVSRTTSSKMLAGNPKVPVLRLRSLNPFSLSVV